MVNPAVTLSYLKMPLWYPRKSMCTMITTIIGRRGKNLSKIMMREKFGGAGTSDPFRKCVKMRLISSARRGRGLLPAALVFAALACASATGSGGTASRLADKINGEPVVPRNANSIFIGEFDDLSGRPDIARRLFIKVKELINRDGRLAVVTGAGAGDLLLSASVTGFQIQAVEFGEQGVPVKKRMRLTASVKLLDTPRGKLIFRDSAVQSFLEYSETVPPLMSEYQAMDALIDSMAERIRAQTITGWYTEYMTPVEKGRK